jgi:hypothetical protein
MNDETGNRDTNAGVGYIERRPRIGERDVEIEEEEINDVTMEQTVGQIPNDSGQEQGQGKIAERVYRTPPQEQNCHQQKRDTGKDDEKSVVVPE